MKNKNFKQKPNDHEKFPMKCFVNIIYNFLRNHKVLWIDLLCNAKLLLHHALENTNAGPLFKFLSRESVCDEQNERFHQGIFLVEKRY